MKLRFYCAFFLLGTALLAQDKPKETPPVIQPATESEFNPAQLKLDPAVSRIIGDFFLSLRKKQIDEAYDVLTKGRLTDMKRCRFILWGPDCCA